MNCLAEITTDSNKEAIFVDVSPVLGPCQSLLNYERYNYTCSHLSIHEISFVTTSTEKLTQYL